MEHPVDVIFVKKRNVRIKVSREDEVILALAQEVEENSHNSYDNVVLYCLGGKVKSSYYQALLRKLY